MHHPVLPTSLLPRLQPQWRLPLLCQLFCARSRPRLLGAWRGASRAHRYSHGDAEPTLPLASRSLSPTEQTILILRRLQAVEQKKKQNMSMLYYAVSLILGFFTLTYGSVPLYKIMCQKNGWGGQPIKVDSAEYQEQLRHRMTPQTDARRIQIRFHASTSDMLPWKFVPLQREVRVLPGETALAFYKATNRSDTDIIGVATYSVTPPQVAPYFSKIQCFCFEEQRLAAGETVDMPVFFFLDPDLLNDINLRNLESVTLSYVFFKAKYDNNGKFTAPITPKYTHLNRPSVDPAVPNGPTTPATSVGQELPKPDIQKLKDT